MKRKLQIGAALAAAITALAPVHALAETVVPRVYKIFVQSTAYLYNKKNDLWYDLDGHLLEKTQKSTQRARWGDDYYTVDLDAEKVYDESGAEFEPLTQKLKFCLKKWQNDAYYYDPSGGNGGIYYPVPLSENSPIYITFDDTAPDFTCYLAIDLPDSAKTHKMFPIHFPVVSEEEYQNIDYDYGFFEWLEGSNGIDGSAFTFAGDLNLNGEVDVVDAVMLARLAAGDSELKLSDLGTALADYNGDGKQGDAADLTRLIRRLALLDEPET